MTVGKIQELLQPLIGQRFIVSASPFYELGAVPIYDTVIAISCDYNNGVYGEITCKIICTAYILTVAISDSAIIDEVIGFTENTKLICKLSTGFYILLECTVKCTNNDLAYDKKKLVTEFLDTEYMMQYSGSYSARSIYAKFAKYAEERGWLEDKEIVDVRNSI